jgi:hypothetical protein
MPKIEAPGPSPYPKDAEPSQLGDLSSERANEGLDPTFGGAAVMVVMPIGSDALLLQRVRQALATALPSSDDPPVTILVSGEMQPSDYEGAEDGNEARRYVGPAALFPLVVKVAKEAIDIAAREVRHRQQVAHAAERAHMRDVEGYHKRADAWRTKTFG